MSVDGLGLVLHETFRDVAQVIYEQIRDGGDGIGDDAPFVQESTDYVDRHGAHLNQGGARNPFDLFAMLLLTQLFAIVDFMRGIGNIAAPRSGPEGEVGLSAAPLARALLESLAKLHWLVEEGVGADERVRRLADDTIREEQGRHGLLAHLGASDIQAILDTGGLAEMCDNYRLKWRWSKPDETTGVKFPVLEGGRRPGAFDILSPLLSSKNHVLLGAAFYSLMSDVAHASTQGLLRHASVKDSGAGLEIRFDRREILRGVAPAMWALNTPVTNTYAYLGWDADRFRETFADAVSRIAEAFSADGDG